MIRENILPRTKRVVVAACLTNQANRLGIPDRKGTLAIGKDADIVILDSDGKVELTICRGTIAYERITACN